MERMSLIYVADCGTDDIPLDKQALVIPSGIAGDKFLIGPPCQNCADESLIFVDGVIASSPHAKAFAIRSKSWRFSASAYFSRMNFAGASPDMLVYAHEFYLCIARQSLCLTAFAVSACPYLI
jgi:hypothetical protein